TGDDFSPIVRCVPASGSRSFSRSPNASPADTGTIFDGLGARAPEDGLAARTPDLCSREPQLQGSSTINFSRRTQTESSRPTTNHAAHPAASTRGMFRIISFRSFVVNMSGHPCERALATERILAQQG